MVVTTPPPCAPRSSPSGPRPVGPHGTCARFSPTGSAERFDSPSGAPAPPRSSGRSSSSPPPSRAVAAAREAIATAPSGQAVWDCLYLALPKRRRTLERRLLPALHAPLKKRNRKPSVRLAIDYHRIAYFGEPNRDTTRAKETAGTHTFHTYATAGIVGGPDRYTLGLTAVGEKEPFTTVLTRLLDQVASAGVTIRVVLLDKAFFSIAVMQLLQSRSRPFVIPAVIRGRKPRIGVKAVGLRALRNRGAGRYEYTHEDRGTSVRIRVAVAHKGYRHKKTGRPPEQGTAVRDVARER
jgi:hypothetical protein